MTDVAASAKPTDIPVRNNTVLGLQGTLLKQFLVQSLPVEMTHVGAGALSRLIQDIIRELGTSVVSYGADPTGVADSTAAFAAAIASGASKIRIPAGTYKVSSITVDKQVALIGDGQNSTVINVTTTTTHGMVIRGASALGASNIIRLQGFKLNYTGAGQPVASGGNNNFAGIYIQRKVIMDEVFVNGFTNDGIYFAPYDASESGSSVLGTIGNAVFFAELRNVWSKNNGRDGIRVRMGANANVFTNCQFSNNGGCGFHHLTDGGSTYGNTVVGGQASYNTSYGYHFENGTNITTSGLYAEFNGSPTNTNSDGYTNTPYDFYVGDNCVRSWIGIGTLFSASTTHVRPPAFNPTTIQVWEAGRQIFGNT